MNKIIALLFIISFFGITSLPHLQNKAFKLNHYRLSGYETKINFPMLDFTTFLNSTYQEKIAEYISQNIGLRSYFVRTDNQISISIFGQLSPKTAPQVVIGKDDMLIERVYIKELNNKFIYDPVTLKKLADNLLKLQEYLHKKNKAFLLLISPSKAELYKENIPKEFLKTENKAVDKLDLFRQYLDQLNVKYIDGPKLFAELKQKLDIPLFSHTGTHWSYYPACLFLSQGIAEIEKQIPINMLDLNCGEAKLASWPIGTDKDLLHLLNIWKARSFLKNTYYSQSSVVRSDNTVRPPMLIVGTSFVWQLLKYNDKYHIFSNRDYFYYFNVNYSNRGFLPEGKIDKENLNLEQVLENKDVILLETNETNIEQLGYGFLEQINKFVN